MSQTRSPPQPQPPRRATARDVALARFETGDHATAAPLLVAALAQHPMDPVLLRCCGMALLRTGEADRGARHLARARRAAPSDPVAALWHGLALQAAGRLDEAVDALSSATSLSPGDPVPLVHRSRVLLQAGRSADAMEAARGALALAPQLAEAEHALRVAELASRSPPDASVWSAVAAACLRLDRIDEARAALEQACATSQDTASAVLLARVLHVCGQPLEAVARLRALLVARPGDAAAALGLATCLLMQDEADEALQLLDEANAASAPRGRAVRIATLLDLGRIDEARQALGRETGDAGDAEILFVRHGLRLAAIDRRQEAVPGLANWLGTLAMRPDGSWIEDRLDALFLLGELHHSENRPDAAFAHWREGHRLLSAAQPFKRDTHRAVLDGIMRSATGDGPVSARPDEAPVFIVGLPRTGTTLTEHILAAHRDVHGAGERLAMRETVRALGGTDTITTALDRVAALDADRLTESAATYLSALTALAPDKRYVLDKMPDNVLLLDAISRLLPGARMIVCTRDPRDVGFSIFRQRFIGHHPYAHDLADLGWFIRQHAELIRHWQRVLPGRLLTLDHSEWVTDFQGTLRRVLDFLDLPHDPNCENFHAQDRRVRTASRDQVRRPVNANGTGTWRHYERQLAPMLRALDGAG